MVIFFYRGGDNNEYVYLSGFEIIKFAKEDESIDFISIMDGDMRAYTIAVGERYKHFISQHYIIFENIKIEEETQSNSTNDSLDPFDY